MLYVKESVPNTHNPSLDRSKQPVRPEAVTLIEGDINKILKKCQGNHVSLWEFLIGLFTALEDLVKTDL